jgi:hypothetical protein
MRVLYNMVLCWANFERYQAANRKIAAMFFFNHTVIVQNDSFIEVPLSTNYHLSKKRKDTSSRSTVVVKRVSGEGSGELEDSLGAIHIE